MGLHRLPSQHETGWLRAGASPGESERVHVMDKA